MSNLLAGTLTVFHTDLENSTLLTHHLREQYPVVLATHRTLLRAAFTAHEGWEVDTQGDGFFVVFPRTHGQDLPYAGGELSGLVSTSLNK